MLQQLSWPTLQYIIKYVDCKYYLKSLTMNLLYHTTYKWKEPPDIIIPKHYTLSTLSTNIEFLL